MSSAGLSRYSLAKKLYNLQDKKRNQQKTIEAHCNSKAKMKVGALGSRAARNCDFILNMGNQYGADKYIVQLNAYLSNPKIK
jgi:hypothetical protein